MTIDLRALLAQADKEEEKDEGGGMKDEHDLCAGERVRIVLELLPHEEVGLRSVQGTIGVAGQLPVFIAGGVTFGEVGGVLQGLYRTFCGQYVARGDVEMGEEMVVAAVPLADGDGESGEALTLF